MIDVLIVGGGIAGLWTLQRLRALGYDAVLVENKALGAGQTIASQGIIHSGLKYGLAGLFRGEMAAMPARWYQAFNKRGDVMLQSVKMLATHQLLHTDSAIFGALAATLLRGKTKRIGSGFYLLGEPVLDVKSLLWALSEGAFQCSGPPVLRARATLFACGIGNEVFAGRFGEQAKPTIRPLRMVMVHDMPREIFAHWLGKGAKPRVTVTSHRLNGKIVWYLGGNIAEEAVNMPRQEALTWARSEMRRIMPGECFDWKSWAVHDVDRAEPAGASTSRPYLVTNGDKAMAWPSKLTLAPALSDRVLDWLKEIGVRPSHRRSAVDLPPATVARYPWETATWQVLP